LIADLQNSRKILLLTYNLIIISWIKFPYCVSKRWNQ
jgi:hypothetical protein